LTVKSKWYSNKIFTYCIIFHQFLKLLLLPLVLFTLLICPWSVPYGTSLLSLIVLYQEASSQLWYKLLVLDKVMKSRPENEKHKFS